MSRQKISEFSAKTALYPTFNLNFRGLAVTQNTPVSVIAKHFGDTNLVVKVDQGIKKRGKLGLIKINLKPSEVPKTIATWAKQGWSNFLVEPVYEHHNSVERYLSLARTRQGWDIKYSGSGGIEIESHWDSVTNKLPTRLEEFINQELIPKLDEYHIAFLEMNPIIVRDEKIIPLDMAVEIDSAGSILPTIPDQHLSESEQAIAELDKSTPASLKFHLINPNGSIWMLLSGGGASLVLADEVADLGLGAQLANYGEYSGDPTDDDVYFYTKIILKQMLSSLTFNFGPHALVIAGGVANFTDVSKTFKGIIRALAEQKDALNQSGVKVFVRRGGPNEAAGLKLMRDFLAENALLGCVYGHDKPLTQVITEANNYLKRTQ
ncbi:MAG: ATP citrate lyase citrate-binding domain-containing protein [Candidatus Microgenomates bacterium]